MKMVMFLVVCEVRCALFPDRFGWYGGVCIIVVG